MRAIRVLHDEHRVLCDVLSALELVLDRQLDTDVLEADLAVGALEWCERFADGLHQDREEVGLLPVLLRRAPKRTRDLIEDLQSWHARERTLLARMRAWIEGAAYGDSLSRDSFMVAARAYVEFQRRHSDIEDVTLLPLARAVLTRADDREVLAVYHDLERRHIRPDEPHPFERARSIVNCSLERSHVLGFDRILIPFGNRRAAPPAIGIPTAV